MKAISLETKDRPDFVLASHSRSPRRKYAQRGKHCSRTVVFLSRRCHGKSQEMATKAGLGRRSGKWGGFEISDLRIKATMLLKARHRPRSNSVRPAFPITKTVLPPQHYPRSRAAAAPPSGPCPVAAKTATNGAHAASSCAVEWEIRDFRWQTDCKDKRKTLLHGSHIWLLVGGLFYRTKPSRY